MTLHLVSTSIYNTWSSEKTNLFLGKWCTRQDQYDLLLNYKFNYSVPYYPSAEDQLKDMDYILGLTKNVLGELVVELNKLHGVNHGEKYWNIVLGHWLHRYVCILFNRFVSIDLVFKTNEVESYTNIDSNFSLITADSSTFIQACNDDIWNQFLYQKIISFMNLKMKTVNEKMNLPECFNLPSRATSRKSVKQKVRVLLSSILSFFSKQNDAFLISTYMPKWDEVKLSFLLGQLPHFWTSPKFDQSKIDFNLRSKLNFQNDHLIGLEKLVRVLLPEMIPVVYIEGYQAINQEITKLPWPSTPKFIFTSNNFDTDEVFKIWAAKKVEAGALYITGQHGNNYGTHFYAGTKEWPERASSDVFITWGWKDLFKNTKAGFNFKLSLSNYKKYNPLGKLLLIENCLPHMITPWDVYSDFEIYQEEQFLFASSFSVDLQKELLVRLHGGFRSLKWNDDQRWLKRLPQIKLETGQSSINSLIAESRLVVHSYDSTGILETLALNIPTMCFWNGGFDHLLPEVRDDYQILKNASIFFDNPKECAEFIEKNWHSIEKWWSSKDVQKARELFCEKYSKIEKNPATEMKKLLLSSLKPEVEYV